MPGFTIPAKSDTTEIVLLKEINEKLDEILGYMRAAESAIKGVKLPPMVASMMGIPPNMLEGNSHDA